MKSFETGLRDDILAADLRPILRLPVSPSQRLLKNMKFEGIEIALEGIWYEDNR
jgi:hypothetical protein